MAYATTALVKTFLSITSNADDTLIGTLITRAQAVIDNYTHRTFEVTSDTTKVFDSMLDVRGTYRTLLLFNEGLELAAAPTTITNGDLVVLVLNTDCVTLPANTAPFYGLEMLRSTSNQWTQTAAGDTQRAISIVGKWGYSTSAPADIVAATIRLVSYMYRQRESNTDLDRAVSVADGMVLLPANMPNDVITMLAPYKRFAV